MKLINLFLSGDIANAIGWTIVHSLWQYAIMAILLGLIMILARRFSSRTRYFIAISALGLCFSISVLTFIFQLEKIKGIAEVVTMDLTNELISEANVQPKVPVEQMKEKEEITTDIADSSAEVLNFRSYFSRNLPFIVTFWLLGVLVLLLKFLGGVAYAQRIKYYRSQRINDFWDDKVKVLSNKLNITRGIKILQSTNVSTPMLIGYLKPVVLIPASLISGVSTEQLEMIVMHELAHIQRKDYLVNLFQKVVEIVMFYHPAIWWISSIINSERENCCDDIALTHSENKVDYAKALVTLQEQVEKQPELAMAFTGPKNKLFKRIKRFIGEPKIQANFTEGFITACFLIVGLVVVSFNIYSAGNTSVIGNSNDSIFASETDSLRAELEKTNNQKQIAEMLLKIEQQKSNNSEGDPELDDLKGMYEDSQKSRKVEFTAPNIVLNKMPVVKPAPQIMIKPRHIFVDKKDIDVGDWTVREKSFLEAAFYGHVDVMKVLLENNAEFSDDCMNKAFQDAAFYGHLEVVDFLTSKGYTFSEDKLNEAFKNAAFYGHDDIVNYFLEGNFKISHETMMQAFKNAAFYGHSQVVNLYFEKGIEVDENTMDEAFVSASKYGHSEIIKILLANGYNPSKAYSSPKSSQEKVVIKTRIKYDVHKQKEDVEGMFEEMNYAVDKTIRKMKGESDYERKTQMEDEMFETLHTDAQQIARTLDVAIDRAVEEVVDGRELTEIDRLEIKGDIIDDMYDDLDKYMDPFFDKLGDEYMPYSPRPAVVGGNIASLAITIVSTDALQNLGGVNIMGPLGNFLGNVFNGNPEEIEKAAEEFGKQMEEFGKQMEEYGNSIGNSYEDGSKKAVP